MSSTRLQMYRYGTIVASYLCAITFIMALTAKQILQRRDMITSSRIYDVAMGNYHKAWRSIKGLDNFTGNEATERGDELEGAIRKWSARRLQRDRNLKVRAIKPTFRQHPTCAWAGDSCDVAYWSGSKLEFVGEIKTAAEGVAREYGSAGTDQVPEYTLIQSHWHLIHYPEASHCVVSALLGGFHFGLKLFDVSRDAEMHGMLLEAGERFYRDFLLSNREPPADGHNDTTEYFRKRFPSGNGQLVETTEEFARAATEYKRIKAEAKALEEQAQKYSNQLLAAVGPNAGLTYQGKKIVGMSDIAAGTIIRSAHRRMNVYT